MSERIKFHLDENFSNAIADGLRRRGINVTTTAEVNLISASDEKQIKFALNEKRVIFTQDDDFLKLHKSGISHYGILIVAKEVGVLAKLLTL